MVRVCVIYKFIISDVQICSSSSQKSSSCGSDVSEYISDEDNSNQRRSSSKMKWTKGEASCRVLNIYWSALLMHIKYNK